MRILTFLLVCFNFLFSISLSDFTFGRYDRGTRCEIVDIYKDDDMYYFYFPKECGYDVDFTVFSYYLPENFKEIFVDSHVDYLKYIKQYSWAMYPTYGSGYEVAYFGDSTDLPYDEKRFKVKYFTFGENYAKCSPYINSYPIFEKEKTLQGKFCTENCDEIPTAEFRFDCLCKNQSLGNLKKFVLLNTGSYNNNENCLVETENGVVDNCEMKIISRTYKSEIDNKEYKPDQFDCAIDCSDGSLGIPATSDFNNMCFNDTKRDLKNETTIISDNETKQQEPDESVYNPDDPLGGGGSGENNAENNSTTSQGGGSSGYELGETYETGGSTETTINNENNGTSSVIINNGGGGKDNNSTGENLGDLSDIGFDWNKEFDRGYKDYLTNAKETENVLDEMKEKSENFLNELEKNFNDIKNSIDNLIQSLKDPFSPISHNQTCSCVYDKNFQFYAGYSTRINFDFCEFICQINSATYLFFYGVLSFMFIRFLFMVLLRLI